MSALPPVVNETGQTKFQNWHENYRVGLRRRLDIWNGDASRSTLAGYRATTAGLQKLIKESLNAGERIRALGGGWSFSRAPAVDGTLINTKPLNYRFKIGTSAVSAGYSGNRRNLFFVQCGNSIAELNWYLFDRQRSLPTSGASNGQTLGGALSTGTHGSAIDFGAIPEFVKALHLIVSPTRHVWLERASDPVVLDSKLPTPLGAEVIRDDDIFNAALVSFGSFGIIHGVVIEADDKYFLNVFREKMPRKAALRAAMETLDLSSVGLPRDPERPHHFAAVINPFNPDHVYVTTMYRDAEMPADANLPQPTSGITQGDDALGIVGILTDLFGDLTPILASTVLDSAQGDVVNIAGTPGQIFRDTSTRGRASSSAMGVPLERANEVIDLFIELNQEIQAPALIACRYVRSTPATLGFTSHGERTAVVEIDGPTSSRVRRFHQRAWGLLRARNIPHTFHWGKQHDLTARLTREAYGEDRVEAWLAARRTLLTTRKLRDAFSNDMVERAGLNA